MSSPLPILRLLALLTLLIGPARWGWEGPLHEARATAGEPAHVLASAEDEHGPCIRPSESASTAGPAPSRSKDRHPHPTTCGPTGAGSIRQGLRTERGLGLAPSETPSSQAFRLVNGSSNANGARA